MIYASGAGLASDIDDLDLDIDSEGFMTYKAFKVAVTGAAAFLIYTYSFPSDLSGDCVACFNILTAGFGQPGGDANNRRIGQYCFVTAKRIGGVVTIPPSASYWDSSYISNIDGLAYSIAPSVSGSTILFKVTCNASYPVTYVGTIEIFGMRIP